MTHLACLQMPGLGLQQGTPADSVGSGQGSKVADWSQHASPEWGRVAK